MSNKTRKKNKANNLFEEPVMLFLGKVCDMLFVNIFWIICCLPVFTIGASTSAMYYVSLKMARNDTIHSFKDFFIGFKLTFKRAALSMLFVIPLVLISYLDISFIKGNGLGLPVYALVVFAIPVLLVLMFVSILFPLYAFYQDNIRTTIRNAFYLIVRHPLTMLLVLVINLVPIIMLFWFFETFLEWIIVWTFLGFGLLAYINSKLLLRIFHKDLRESDYPYIDPDTPY